MSELVRWLADHTVDGALMFRIGVLADEVVAEWAGVGRLTAKRDGSTWSFEADPAAEPPDVEKVRRGSMAMLLRHLAGKLALHGSAVALEDGAVVLTGESGRGKSTLAAALVETANAALLSDDLVAIDAPSSVASWTLLAVETDHWLDADARRSVHGTPCDGAGGADSAKVPVRASRLATRAEPLRAIVELAFADVPEPRLVALRGLDAVRALVPQSVRFVIDEPGRHKAELDRLASLVESVGMFRLERPRRLELLPTACDLVATVSRASNVR